MLWYLAVCFFYSVQRRKICHFASKWFSHEHIYPRPISSLNFSPPMFDSLRQNAAPDCWSRSFSLFSMFLDDILRFFKEKKNFVLVILTYFFSFKFRASRNKSLSHRVPFFFITDSVTWRSSKEPIRKKFLTDWVNRPLSDILDNWLDHRLINFMITISLTNSLTLFLSIPPTDYQTDHITKSFAEERDVMDDKLNFKNFLRISYYHPFGSGNFFFFNVCFVKKFSFQRCWCN